MRITVYTLALAFLALCVVGDAIADDPARNATERVRDQQERRDDRQATADDHNDQLEIDRLQDKFEDAAKAADADALARVDDEVMTYLRAEAAEAGIEITQAERESRRDRREIRSDRHEARGNRRSGALVGVKANDRHDRRDDRRDIRDDHRDAEDQRDQRDHLTDIIYEWESLLGDHDNTSVERKRVLLGELEVMAHAEVAENTEEAVEDRRETREDRRETREDRRGRR